MSNPISILVGKSGSPAACTEHLHLWPVKAGAGRKCLCGQQRKPVKPKTCSPKLAKPSKPKAIRVRHVFGRVRLNYGGKPVKVTMTMTHLHVQPLHSHKTWSLPLVKAVEAVLGYAQGLRNGVLKQLPAAPSGSNAPEPPASALPVTGRQDSTPTPASSFGGDP